MSVSVPNPIEGTEWSIEDWLGISTVYALDYGNRTHYHVDIPAEVRDYAQALSKSEVDYRDERDYKESRYDSEQGKIAEFAFATVCEYEDVNWKFHDGYETGDLEVDGITVDVKCRRENEDGYMDLLVGMRGAGNERDIQADSYVQVLLDSDFKTALVTGFVLNFEVVDAQYFGGARTYPSKIVPHDELRDLRDWF